jgi:hypothetical protein
MASNAKAAAPECNLTTRATSAQQVYDPFSSSDILLDVDISVTNNSEDKCTARYYLAPVNGTLALFKGIDRLTFRVEGPRGGGNLPETYGPFVLHLDSKETESITVRTTVPARQLVPRGDYYGDLAITAFGNGNQPITIASPPVTLRVRVPGRVEMTISGSISAPFPTGPSGGAAISFGEAATGSKNQVYVHVWANGEVSISLDSENRGRLKLLDSATDGFIDYSARFDGVPAPLSSRYSVRRAPPMTQAGGAYELAITLGDTRSKFAGTYKDVITVTVDQN